MLHAVLQSKFASQVLIHIIDDLDLLDFQAQKFKLST